MRRLKPIDSISENDYIHFLPTLSTAAAHTNVGFLLHDPCMLATITVCLMRRSVRPLSSTTAFLSGGISRDKSATKNGCCYPRKLLMHSFVALSEMEKWVRYVQTWRAGNLGSGRNQARLMADLVSICEIRNGL
jgi:hypothetical protein